MRHDQISCNSLSYRNQIYIYIYLFNIIKYIIYNTMHRFLLGSGSASCAILSPSLAPDCHVSKDYPLLALA
jgi:hypothetical protein